jgi:hypothetical protein
MECSYRVYILTNALDCEPELMGTTATIACAWERVYVDIRAAHDSVPLECPKLEDYARFPNYGAYKATISAEKSIRYARFDPPDTLVPGGTAVAAIADGCTYYVCNGESDGGSYTN